jgi:hypothetical protein
VFGFADPNSHTNAYSDTNTNSDPNSHADTHSNPNACTKRIRVQSV